MLFATVVQTLGLLALVAFAAALALFVALALPAGRARLGATFAGRERHPLAWAWGVALIATLGSLYLSEIAHLQPCTLCWYQRIAMYPLVVVLGVGALRGDAGAWRYALPLPLVGGLISAYHVALQLNPGLEIVPCTSGTPCSARLVAVFGFVSIPVMAGAAFLLIAALLLAVRQAEARGGEDA
ncbi:MAG: disulfide bond formation protein B [Gemmatimonadetes bacterium]|nr:MAG: disulfide bond formation protein B [Gemmatimonadota bacterium]